MPRADAVQPCHATMGRTLSLVVHHLALRTPDPSRLERFYAGFLGLRVARRDAARGSVWLETGTVVVMIEPAAENEPSPNRASQELLAFGIDPQSLHPDLPAWRKRLAESDVAIEAETPFTLYFRDPEGRRLALSTYVFRAPGE
jgi:catechol 2,3-dioxygenase-like lactoylglutathione lyase family enzyme